MENEKFFFSNFIQRIVNDCKHFHYTRMTQEDSLLHVSMILHEHSF